MSAAPTRKFSGKAEPSVAHEGHENPSTRGVRTFRAQDIDRVMEILRESPEAAGWSRESFLEAVEEKGALALVFERDGDLQGFLIGRVVGDQAEVLNLAVSRAHRRSNIGTVLLDAALSEIRSTGGASVYLEVRESNTGASAFYEKHGFAKVGRRKGYYQDPVEAAVTMARRLTP